MRTGVCCSIGTRVFQGLFDLEMDNRIRPLLRRYADFDFRIDTEGPEWAVRFSRLVDGQPVDNIKVSRGEENIFIWCFFLAVVELAMDADIEAYQWVKYLYIDDPISSLDEHNAIAVANHLAQLLKRQDNRLKTVISTHHTLFSMCSAMNWVRRAAMWSTSTRPTAAICCDPKRAIRPSFTMLPLWLNCIRPRRKIVCSRTISICCARFLRRRRVSTATKLFGLHQARR